MGEVGVSAPEAIQVRVVDPVLDQVALENARLVNAARAALLTSGTAVTVYGIAGALDKGTDTVRRWVARQRSARRLVTVTHEGQMYIPTVQLDGAFDVNDGVAEVVGRLVDHGMSGWAVWHWFESPNAWLDGDIPARLVRSGDLDAVGHAVDGMFQE